MRLELSKSPYSAEVSKPPPSRADIERIQELMIPISCELPEPEHHFAPGMYGRALTIPAGMAVVGKIHKHGHLLLVTKGHAVVVDEFGKYEVRAGFIQASKPGAKRVVYAHEETTFATVHLNPADSTDLLEIEAEHIEPESDEFIALMAEHKIGALS